MEAVESSLSILKDQGAMTEEEKLTSSGCMLAKLPVDVVIGKMLIMGTLFHVSACRPCSTTTYLYIPCVFQV